MKRIIYLAFLLILVTGTTARTQETKFPSNFAGVDLSIDLLHLSRAVGISYERMVHTGHAGALSLKAKYFLPHRNDIIGQDDGYKSDISASQYQFLLNGYLFAGGRERPFGLFLSGGVGILYTQRKLLSGSEKDPNSGLSTGGELSIGGHSPISDKHSLQYKLSLGVFFGNGNYGYFLDDRGNNYILPGLSVAFGF